MVNIHSDWVRIVRNNRSTTAVMEPARLDAEKKAIFESFKVAIGDCRASLMDSTDDYILKWLIARDFNSEQAEKMLRMSLQWRKTNRVDEITEHWEPPVVLVKYFPMGIVGRDKFDCPLWVMRFGQTDWKGLLLSVGKRDLIRYIVYLAENSMAEMRRNSLRNLKPITYQTFIIDFDGLSMRQMSYKPFRDMGIDATKMSEANYPESLRRVFIVNAPKVFTFVFGMIKPFLHQATLDKIRVFGYDKDEWEAALLEEIDASQLPASYGGTMTDPDGNAKCPSKCNLGGEVPDSFYMEVQKPKPTKEMTSLTVSNISKKKLQFAVNEENSVLKWKFLTEEGDIGFGIYFSDSNDERAELVPVERVDSHQHIEEGEVVCSKRCTYTVEFDNSFSYLRSKKLWYDIKIEAPERDCWEEAYNEQNGTRL